MTKNNKLTKRTVKDDEIGKKIVSSHKFMKSSQMSIEVSTVGRIWKERRYQKTGNNKARQKKDGYRRLKRVNVLV